MLPFIQHNIIIRPKKKGLSINQTSRIDASDADFVVTMYVKW